MEMTQRAVTGEENLDRSYHSGFTLIELLTVVAIIGLLAALIIPLAGVANTMKRKAEARAMIDMLDAAINQYHTKKGFYPPDNNVNGSPVPFPNQLFYELSGVTAQNSGTAFSYPLFANETIDVTTVKQFFNVGGFVNASTDPTETFNFIPTVKPGQLARISDKNKPIVWAFVCKSPGPMAQPPAFNGVTTNINGVKINPVQYVVSNATNRATFFDLWVDIVVGGKTNRISNWSKDPIPVSY